MTVSGTKSYRRAVEIGRNYWMVGLTEIFEMGVPVRGSTI
jgi:hypothetical protein